MFHQFSDKKQKCLLLVAIDNAPQTRKLNHEALERHHQCQGKKSDVLNELNLEKTKEGLIQVTYYCGMYSSDDCWKGDVKLVQGKS